MSRKFQIAHVCLCLTLSGLFLPWSRVKGETAFLRPSPSGAMQVGPRRPSFPWDPHPGTGLGFPRSLLSELLKQAAPIPRVSDLARSVAMGELRVPAEFEEKEALVLATGEISTIHERLFLALVSAASRHAKVVLLINNHEERLPLRQLLATSGIPQGQIILHQVPHDTFWVRDYGPVFVEQRAGALGVVDTQYGCMGRPEDDRVPRVLSSALKLQSMEAVIDLEGGNLLSNGRGLVLSTKLILAENSAIGLTEQAVRKVFLDKFGATQLVLLDPLVNEGTGHVDMFAMFTAPNTVLVGAYDSKDDPANAILLDRNAMALSRVRTPEGPLKVVRIPMPPRPDGVWRTYTNGILLNGAVLAPTYDQVDRRLQNKAFEVLRRCLPGWRLVPIDASDIIPLGGALHCISLQIPRTRFPLAGFPLEHIDLDIWGAR